MKKLALIIVFAVFGTNFTSAQISKVEQEVFGMDCAPCAYGLERGLKKMDGVEKVKVSLNDGKAFLDLAADNSLNLQKIHDEVKSNGFAAKDAEVTLKGTLAKNNEQLILKVSGETFLISPESSPNALKKIKALREGESIKVEGKVAEEKAGGSFWDLRVLKVS